MKSIEDITREIIQNFDSSESSLDTQPGSDVHTLIRAIATVQSEQQREIEKSLGKLSINEAKGEDLDNWAASFYLSRREGNKAQGNVMALSEEKKSIPSGISLVDLETGVKFQTTSEKTLNSFIEKTIPVKADKSNQIHNLSAGTELFSEEFSNIQFVVGEYRDSNGELCGGLSGGRQPESDEQLRSRVVSRLVNQKTNSSYSLKAIILAEPDVVWVDTETPLPGFVIVWIDPITPITEDRLNYFRTLVRMNRAAGVISEVKTVNKRELNFSINAFINQSEVDLNETTSALKRRVIEFLYRLSLGEKLEVRKLKNFLLDTPGIDYLELIEPNENIELTNDNVFRPSSIKITYDYST